MELIFTLKDEFEKISDPRVLGRTKHNLVDILILSAIAIICHAETWTEIEDFGASKIDWLRKFIDLPNGVPSHDTIARVFSLIDPEHFQKVFIDWINRVRKKVKSDTICIDGKVLSGTVERKAGTGREKVSTVNVWSTSQGLVLGQMRSGSGYGEANAVKDLLDILDFKGMIVVGDAGIGTRNVINKLVEKKADYLFPIKGNSRRMHKAVTEAFDEVSSNNTEKFIIKGDGHGRSETRQGFIIRKKNFPDGLNIKSDGVEDFFNVKAIGKVVYESAEKEKRPIECVKDPRNPHVILRKTRTNKIRIKREVRYFITSLELPIKELMDKLRLQWSIENKLHWILDVSLGEDGNKTRNKNAAVNMSLVRKIAFNLAKQDKSSNLSVKRKLKRAGWENRYLEQLLFKKSLQ